MADQKIRSNLNLQNRQIKNASPEKVAFLPSTNLFEGRQVYNTTNHKNYYYDGANWVELGGGGGGGPIAWGDIGGDLGDQTDLQTALNDKQDLLTEDNFGAFSTALTAKTTPVDADEFGIVDSAASSIMKKITWANIKAALLAIFIPRTQTVTVTASRDLALTDACNLLDSTSASAVVLTVRTNATVAIPVGATINLYQSGTGQLSVAAASGVTIEYAEGLKIAARYKGASLYQKATDVWVFVGAIAA